jgi:uridine phosphorylase
VRRPRQPTERDRPVFSAAQFNEYLLRPGLDSHVNDTVVLAWKPAFERLKMFVRAVPADTWVHRDSRPQWVSTRGVSRPISLFELPTGAPAAAALVEIAAVAGAARVICLGAAGVIDEACRPGMIVAATAAFGTDGTTPHYWPDSAGCPVAASPALLAGLVEACGAEGISLLQAPVCTTDGWFRETPAKIEEWVSWGAVAVEMETAAVYAAAEETGVQAACLLYATDDLVGGVWDPGAGPQRIGSQIAGICRAVLRFCARGEGRAVACLP